MGSFAVFAKELPVAFVAKVLSGDLSAKQNSSDQTVKIDFSKNPEGRSVFVFLSSSCPCSHSYLKELRRVSALFENDKVKFWGVNSNFREDSNKAQEYFSSQRLGFEVLDDRDQKILTMFEALKTPHVFVVENKTRKIIYHGGVGSTHVASSGMSAYLETALGQGMDPDPKVTKTLGCLIERL